jgi:hypothetical protein
MRGRLPSGPEFVDGRPGEDIAKERVKAVYETMAGLCRVQDACKSLGISEPRFEQLRQQVVDAGVERLTPRRAGRPARTTTPELERIGALEAEIADLNVKLKAALVRAEIALALPNVVQPSVSARPNDALPATDGTREPKKKTRRRRSPPRARPPTSRKVP